MRLTDFSGFDKSRSNNVEKRTKDKADFRICRRVRVTPLNNIHPEYDRQDDCAMRCGESVWYDYRDSEGLPHICTVCAATLMNPNFLSAGMAAHASDAMLQDSDHYARIMASLSQSRNGEHKRAR